MGYKWDLMIFFDFEWDIRGISLGFNRVNPLVIQHGVG
jgi:hypothetical protein